MSKENPPKSGPPEDGTACSKNMQAAGPRTETIDLSSLSVESLTPSGSFDLRAIETTAFGKLLQALPIPAFLVDKGFNIVFANDACEKVDSGYKKVRGSSFSLLFPNGLVGKEIQSLLSDLFSSRKPKSYSAALQIGKSRIWGRMHFRPLRTKKGRSALVLVEDLTLEKKQLVLTQKHDEELRQEIVERKKTEEELRKSEEKYRNIIETIEDGYYEVDIPGNLTFFNDRLCEISGYPREELKGMGYRQLMGEENAQKALQGFHKVRTTGKPYKVSDYEIVRKDGTKRNITISVSLIRDPSGQPAGFRGICRDVTERKRAEEELLKIEKLESIGVLAGGIAHDFNNILTAFLGNIALAKMSAQPGDIISRRLEEAEKAVARAQHLTQQLLTFSRGGAPIKKTASVSELVIDSCEFAARGSNVRCEFSVPHDIYPVEVDEGQISQVIGNLVINAEHAMPRGGVIHVRVENLLVTEDDEIPLADGKYVRISVKDHGAGIPAKTLPKIFDPYFTTKLKGTGLGLATAYSIVKGHEGLIMVESEMKVGTTFHIYLPASQKPMTEEKDSDQKVVTGAGRILVMDDEEPIRDMAMAILSMLGYEVDAAKDGDEAFDLYRSAKDSGSPYTAVILDLTVPGAMGGRETLPRLIEIDPEVRAIVSSGYSNDPVMSNYKSYGFSGVVAKPYTPEELSQTLDRVIKHA
jgi:two-component system cell cycle sensor histidine kinase/response regulator CckA